MHCDQIAVLVVLVSLALAVLLTPLYQWLSRGWRLKRHDILDGLNKEARLAYFKRFDQERAALDSTAAFKEFENIYTDWYGRRHYALPIFLLALVASAAITLAALSTLTSVGYLSRNPLFDLTLTGTAAVAGAYMWVADDFIGRSRRLDMAPSNILWGTLRITIAIPMGFAFASVAAPEIGPFVAFSLGAFPIGALTAYLRQLTQKGLKLDQTPEEGSDDIIKLQGVNKAIVERLANEDITTIVQLAYCDPVRLTMRSNLGFNFITDCMSQALAWLYLEEKIEKIRPLGLRGAVEIAYLMSVLNDQNHQDEHKKAECEKAKECLPAIAKALEQDVESLHFCFRQITDDPFTDFLVKVWAAGAHNNRAEVS